MSFKIITDSCSDLDTELRKKYDIDYVKMSVTIGEKVLPASIDWDVYSPREFYDCMRNGTRIYTSQVSRQEYETAFENACSIGLDVLYVGCSSALSASVGLANVIAEEFKKKYPERKIYVLDSLNSSLGEGIMAYKAAIMRDEGKSLEEVAAFLESHKLNIHQFASVDSLKYLKQSGRVKATSAFFGDLMSIKPMIISDAKGNNYAYKKLRGRKAWLKDMVESLKLNQIDIENQYVCISHADDIKTAEELKQMILSEVKCKGVYINYVGPIVGASSGPGTVCMYFVGKKVEICGEN